MTRDEREGYFFSMLNLSSAEVGSSCQVSDSPFQIGSRRELFVDRELIDRLDNTELRLTTPVDAGAAFCFDREWEGPFCHMPTIIADADRFLLYYRGVSSPGPDGNENEKTCIAESRDGIHWTRPELNFFELGDGRRSNVILGNNASYSHNFSPFIDTRPGVDASQRFKALGGVHRTGLIGLVSSDGFCWRKIQDEPVFPPVNPHELHFDSQNVAFWSEHENCYVLYYRTLERETGNKYRWISRAVSDDFIHWRSSGLMDMGHIPDEHLYTNQTFPYFRAPHQYIALSGRFWPTRSVLSHEDGKAIGLTDMRYTLDCSDAVLMTSRGGGRYDRTFREAFVRPGLGDCNWGSRSNFPALNVIQTDAETLSFFVLRNYAQPSAHLRRYELRLDGFASVRAGFSGGEVLTKPLIFDGSVLELNYSTSAAGSVRVEIQDASGAPIPGFSLAESTELIGDKIAGVYSWLGGRDVSSLSGREVRIRFVLRDADLFSYRFFNPGV